MSVPGTHGTQGTQGTPGPGVTGLSFAGPGFTGPA
jgi:hypothetical protein